MYLGLLALVKLYFLHYTGNMEEEKRLLKLCLGIGVLLIAVVALWRVLAYQPDVARKHSSSVASARGTPAVDNSPASSRSMVALLEEPISEQAQERFARQTPSASSYRPNPSSMIVYPQKRATAMQTNLDNLPVGGHLADDNLYDSRVRIPNSQSQSASYHPSGYTTAQVNSNSSAADRVREERARMLAPYLRPNQQDKARMDERWNKLAAALERAVAKALMPKSQKEETVENTVKPQQKQSLQTPGFTGALAPVGEQVAMQKQQIMQSMRQAFGGAAAQQAGGIMDSLAGELSSVLNSADSTAEQKEQQVKGLINKYQKEMDKLTEKSQYDKFVEQRTKEINQQKEEFRSYYGDELSDRLGQSLEEEWQAEQALATQGLSKDEYYEKLAKLRQDKRDEREKLVTEQGQSINPMLEVEKKQAEEQLKNLQQQVAKGEVESVARKATDREIQEMQADVKTKSERILEKIASEPLLGPQVKQALEPLLDDFKDQLNALYQQELSIDDRMRQEEELYKSLNRQALAVQIEHIEKLDLPEEQKRRILEDFDKAYDVFK